MKPNYKSQNQEEGVTANEGLHHLNLKVQGEFRSLAVLGLAKLLKNVHEKCIY